MYAADRRMHTHTHILKKMKEKLNFFPAAYIYAYKLGTITLRESLHVAAGVPPSAEPKCAMYTQIYMAFVVG